MDSQKTCPDTESRFNQSVDAESQQRNSYQESCEQAPIRGEETGSEDRGQTEQDSDDQMAFFTQNQTLPGLLDNFE